MAQINQVRPETEAQTRELISLAAPEITATEAAPPRPELPALVVDVTPVSTSLEGQGTTAPRVTLG